MDLIKETFKQFRIHHYLVLAAVLAIGIFNAVTALSPVIKQNQREQNIVETFNQWWEEEGAAQFIAVGLKADDKTKAEEFVQYRERYLSQNPTYIVEDRLKEMRAQFREWWEINGGKEQYIQEHNVYPKEKEYREEYRKWVLAYTSKFPRYSMAFIPNDADFSKLTTTWLLFPGVLSFLIFAFFFPFAYFHLSERWGIPVTVGIFLLLAVGGGLGVSVMTETSFFDHYIEERYMGASIALAFLLGGTSFGLTKNAVSSTVRGIAIAGVLADTFINWIFYPGIFGATSIVALAAFGLGVVGGHKIPNRVKSKEERNTEVLEARLKKNEQENRASERMKKTRDAVDEAFNEITKAHYEAATKLFQQAVNALLHENPIDKQYLHDLASKLINPELFIDYPSSQWLEWGSSARAKNLFEIALLFLEKGLALEKNQSVARHTLFAIAEIRMTKKLKPEEGILRLKKIIQLGDNDVLAIQAKKILAKIEGHAET